MLQKKVCMLGAFSVGKTSLVRRYVSSMFDEKYLTTVGVKIDKKVVTTDQTDVTLMLWDLAGEDAYNSIKASYLRGAAGCIIVIDGTRPNTFEVGFKLTDLIKQGAGDIPIVIALNKADIKDQWLLEQDQLSQLETYPCLETSAKHGTQVDEMFQTLVSEML